MLTIITRRGAVAADQPLVTCAHGQSGATAWGNEMENVRKPAHSSGKKAVLHSAAILNGDEQISTKSKASTFNTPVIHSVQCTSFTYWYESSKLPKSERWQMSWCSCGISAVSCHVEFPLLRWCDLVLINFQISQFNNFLFYFDLLWFRFLHSLCGSHPALWLPAAP